MCRTSSSPTPTRRPAWCSPGGVSPTGSGCRWIEKYLENKFPPIITLLSQEGGMEISPMSDLANNFSSSTLSPSPWRLSGKVGSSFGWNLKLKTHFFCSPRSWRSRWSRAQRTRTLTRLQQTPAPWTRLWTLMVFYLFCFGNGLLFNLACHD